jgi:hypothetical protein
MPLSSNLGRATGFLVAHRNRLPGAIGRAGLVAGRAILSNLWSVLRQLALQGTGIVFLLFASAFGFHGIEQYRAAHLHGGSSSMALLEIGVCLLFGYFGITSFFRASQLRR